MHDKQVDTVNLDHFRWPQGPVDVDAVKAKKVVRLGAILGW